MLVSVMPPLVAGFFWLLAIRRDGATQRGARSCGVLVLGHFRQDIPEGSLCSIIPQVAAKEIPICVIGIGDDLVLVIDA